MLKKLISIFSLSTATLVAVFLFSASPVFAAGPVCTVPGTYATIQAAVNDAGCTTINVAAGTYTENVTIPRALILNGAKVGVDARTRSGSESIIDGSGAANITITADNVTIDGFTLNGPISQGTAAIVMPIGRVSQNP